MLLAYQANKPLSKIRTEDIDASYNLKIDEGYKHCKGEKHYLNFFLVIYPGMRRGEILVLKWSDINFFNK